MPGRPITDQQMRYYMTLRTRHTRVKISSFGRFTVRDKAPRTGRNPKTGESAPIPPRRVVVFRPSPKLKGRIDENMGGAGEDA